MTKKEFDEKYPLIERWINETIAAHAPEATRVASSGFQRLPQYFSSRLLSFAKVVYVDEVPTPPLSAIGLRQFADFESMEAAGITYFDTIISRKEMRGNEAHHFHELVHVLQWQILGMEGFVAAYADGLEHIDYRRTPLEMMAYNLESVFRKSSNPFDVFDVVSEQVAAIR